MNSPNYLCLSDQVFGKPNKARTTDPSMFELLSWERQGLTHSDFKKKDQNIDMSAETYMGVICKNAWMSETKENFTRYTKEGIPVNAATMQLIQDYVENSKPLPVKQSPIKPNSRQQRSPYHENRMDRGHNHQELKRHQSHNKIKYYESSPPKEKSLSVDQRTKKKLIQNFQQTTRWIPNSAFTTYFGRPPFENYGRNNIKPADGGLVYGSYLYTHNVYPHRGSNCPSKQQSFATALMRSKSKGDLIPEQPRTRPAAELAPEAIAREMARRPIEPQRNNIGHLDIQAPNLEQIMKFGGHGGTKIQKKTKSSMRID